MYKFVAAACLAAIAAGSADAQIVNVTYTGTVTSGYDYAGDFGWFNSDLSGAPIVARFQFDTSKGVVSTGSEFSFIYGGPGEGTQSPALNASLTVNGYTVRFVGSEFGEILSEENYGYSSQFSQANDIMHYLMATVSIYADGPFGSPTFTYDGDLSGADTAGAFYDGNGGGASLQFTSTHLTIRPAAAPEPASWAMMLGGFGLVGGMMRRRRKGAVSFG